MDESCDMMRTPYSSSHDCQQQRRRYSTLTMEMIAAAPIAPRAQGQDCA
jgi:hypothetical protein